MSSAALGRSTFPVEVTNVSAHGFWLLVAERELFVSFAQFPWFRAAAIGAITNVQVPSPHHLYWPDLDIDLALESIEHPEKYPLVSKALPIKALQPTSRAARAGAPTRRARAARG